MRPLLLLALFSLTAGIAAANPDAAPEPEADARIQTLLRSFRLPGATLAVAMDEKLVYAAGYNLDASSRLRIGSISKPFTALTILSLSGQGKLNLDDPVLSILGPDFGAPQDSRWHQVTVRQLLSHRGGFDPAAIGFDPVFPPFDSLADLGLPTPPGPDDIIRMMMRTPLAYTPGTREVYSNFGYLLLGRLIEKISGSTYADCVKKTLLADQNITRMVLGGALESDRLAGEPLYQDEPGAPLTPSFYPPYGELVPRPYGGTHASLIESAGGWVAAAPDLVRFASRMPASLLEASIRRPSWVRPDAPFWTGPAWTVIPVNGSAALLHHGGMPGARSVLLRMPLENGVVGTVAILFAGSPPEHQDEAASTAILTAAIEILNLFRSKRTLDLSSIYFHDGQLPFLEPYGVIHAATGSEVEFAPGQLISIVGANFDRSARVEVNGVPVEVVSVAPDRIQAVLPLVLQAERPAALQVHTDTGASRTVYLPVVESAPGLFRVVMNADGSLNSESHPASPGDRLFLFGTGFGAETVPMLVGELEIVPESRLPLQSGIDLIVIQAPTACLGDSPAPIRPAARKGRGPVVYLNKSSLGCSATP